MIRVFDSFFALGTKETLYLFEKMKSGHLEHLYYGKKIAVDSKSAPALREKKQHSPGNTNSYSEEFNLALEDYRLEMSSFGKSDVRTPFIELIHADGGRTSDFLYDSYKIVKDAGDREGLPAAYNESGEHEHLIVFLKDKNYGLTLELHYLVYDDCNVITRYSRLVNDSSEQIKVERLMSLQLDMKDSDYVITTFNGSWANEMNKHETRISAGSFVNATNCGASSSRANPFVMMSDPDTTEDKGNCYAFNLVYSGNHSEIFEVNSWGKMRVLTGINPIGFSYTLNAGESFVSPEAVMTFSTEGKNGMSQNMHEFVREHIVRGSWKHKIRPILLNSWEAAYFKINEKKLLDLAKEAKNAGAELFVMDDGWFGERNDDTSSLGDWFVNTKKLPGGLKGLVDKVKDLGLLFGIWVEPEMVNVKSKLYEAHPEWVMQIPGKPHTEGRNQRILDFTNREVQDYIIESMSNVFSSADIAYVKWDMNRIYSDVFSQSLPADRQGEVAHRYMLGLYRVLKTLTEKFPDILFEGCASGGNRFDLGVLCYYPQIWASDDTDAFQRTYIQNGYSYGYPMSTVTAHVSACPNHQTLRTSPLDTRFNVAFFGNLGYELNLCELSSKEKEAVKNQIALYKQWRDVMLFGNFYRGVSFDDGNEVQWTCVSRDKKQAAGLYMHNRSIPNKAYRYYYGKGLDKDTVYEFSNVSKKVDIREFGSLINMVSPIPLKQDSLMMDIAAKFVKLQGEEEKYELTGDFLMTAGVWLKQNYAGTGFDESTAYLPDLGSRLYFIKAID